MAVYVIPQAQVFQDYEISPSSSSTTLRSHIAGGHAQLTRYDEPDERSLGLLGPYDPTAPVPYDFPGRRAGGVVDPDYAKVFAHNAILRYYQASAGSGGGVAKVAGKSNQVRSDDTVWKSGAAAARSNLLLDRDVRVGDPVRLRFNAGGGGAPVSVWTSVAGFSGESVASHVAAPTADASNDQTRGSASTTHSQVGGPTNAVVITAADAANYDPYPTGRVTETYTIVVTGSSVGGDLTTASLRVISASGLDDVVSATPAAAGAPTAIGTHGLTVTFDDTGGPDASATAGDEGVSPNDLLVGQRFSVTANAAFTATAAPTAAGTYTGAADATYIATVTRGGKFAGGTPPQVSFTTNTGTDMSGPVDVPAAGTAVPAGTRGLTFTFAGVGLARGDRFYAVASAGTTGALKTLVLANSIPATVADDTPADVSLFIKVTDLQLKSGFSLSDTQVTVEDGVTATDPSWTNGGVAEALPLDADAGQGFSTLYIEYRAWLPDLANSVGGINDVAQLDDLIPGPLSPDNPLKWGVYKALANSNGAEVKYSAVADPTDLNSWVDVLNLVSGRDDVYGLVPLTDDVSVWQLYAAHVNDESDPTQGRWRVAWFGLHGLPSVPVVADGSDVAGHTAATTSDGEVAMATILQDPGHTGPAFTIVHVPGGNSNFISNGVRAGDSLRIGFTTDGAGGVTYEDYVVDEVTTEEELRLIAGPATPVNTASKIEVWRTLNVSEEAAAVGRLASSFGTHLVRAVWPDTIEAGGVTMPGYFLCAALAGLRSGIAPHQGMTNLAVSGFDAVPRTTEHFGRAQLNEMAGNGVWVVTQSPAGDIYTRHAVTTASYDDINKREEVITSNVDSISYRFQDVFAPFIGVTNVTDSLVGLIRMQVKTMVNTLRSELSTTKLGGQLLDAEIVDIRQHLVLRDRVVVILSLDLPYPLNNIDCHLVIPGVTAVDATVSGLQMTVPTTPTTTG